MVYTFKKTFGLTSVPAVCVGVFAWRERHKYPANACDAVMNGVAVASYSPVKLRQPSA